MTNILGFVGHMASVATTQLLCRGRAKATLGNMQVNEHGCASMPLHLWTLKCKRHTVLYSLHRKYYSLRSYFNAICLNQSYLLGPAEPGSRPGLVYRPQLLAFTLDGGRSPNRIPRGRITQSKAPNQSTKHMCCVKK